jgi:EAL domain-containing protein (putative c-di-GMP-specific phosphodiesterase class I)
VLAEIRAKGVRIAVDDLGAGYSNLKYIADLAPEIVKIDRGLVAGLSQHSRLHRLVTSIVQLCTEQGARVVAEGIETAEELRAVLATGAHFAQGYFLARPHREPPTPDWERLFRSL